MGQKMNSIIFAFLLITTSLGKVVSRYNSEQISEIQRNRRSADEPVPADASTILQAGDSIQPINDDLPPVGSTPVQLNVDKYKNDFNSEPLTEEDENNIPAGDFACFQISPANSGASVSLKSMVTSYPGSNAESLQLISDFCTTSTAERFDISVENYNNGRYCFTMHYPSEGGRSVKVDLTVELCTANSCQQCSKTKRRRRRSISRTDRNQQVKLEPLVFSSKRPQNE